MSVGQWDTEYSYEETVEVAIDLSTQYADRIVDPELKAALKQALQDRNFGAIVAWDLDLSGRLSVSDVINARQALGFFQKLDALDIGIDKEAAARTKFLEAELRCRETNDLFTKWSAGMVTLPKGVDGILHAAQRKIQKVLGRVPALSELDLMFGPGATTSVPRRNACKRIKLNTALSCSTNFLGVLPSFLREVPAWRDNLIESFSVDGDDLVELMTVSIHDGKLAFVPKNAKTYRSVMTEPTCNTMLQGGYGRWIAKRLRRVGLDIRDQSKNQRLARLGSLMRVLATLDLSSASDLLARELVSHLLPFDWYSALDSCRTSVCTDRGVVIRLEKFASMGNGFTFPLQTLIFWALVSACCEPEDDVSVYGDDIICPVSAVPEVFRVFNVCGFLVNKEKSYWSGPFRESCGADYYFGISVRPYYLKKLVSNERLFSLHNFLVRNYDEEMAARVLRLIPEHLRIWGPDGYGDGHLIGAWSPRPFRREMGWGGFLFDTFVKTGRAHTRALPGDRVLPVYSVYVRGAGDEPPLALKKDKRGVVHDTLPGVTGYKQVRIYTLSNA